MLIRASELLVGSSGMPSLSAVTPLGTSGMARLTSGMVRLGSGTPSLASGMSVGSSGTPLGKSGAPKGSYLIRLGKA